MNTHGAVACLKLHVCRELEFYNITARLGDAYAGRAPWQVPVATSHNRAFPVMREGRGRAGARKQEGAQPGEVAQIPADPERCG